ncbi:MAG TPA: PQQ-binding-like beta-propeller repeat protein [Gemmataceae bacterium]|nr:PQQ-binding-like beta-propeller repeat protein [Gemmataceae bacterium]
MRRALVMVAGVVFLAAFAFLASDVAQGQKVRLPPGAGPVAPPGTTPPGVVDLADKGRLTLPTDPKLKAKLKAAKEYIESEEWRIVAETVQGLLDLPEDVFVQMPVKQADGKEVETLVGIRIAANRLLASVPRGKPGVGLDVYDSIHGPSAKKLLADAIADSDKQKFAEVAQRFLWTEAGAEAAERLATILMDRGDFTAAAQAFDRLIQRDGVEKLEPLTLYKAAIAFHKGNTKEDKDNKDKVWKQLQAKSPEGFSAGGQTVTLEDAEKYLDRIRGGVNNFIYDWPMVGGNPSRSGQGVGDTAFMQPLWKTTLFSGDTSPIKAWIDGNEGGAVRRLENKGEAVIPAFAPVTATVTTADGKQKTLLVYRSYEGVAAIGLKTGKREWISYSPWSLERMHKDGQKQPALTAWVGQFKDQYSKPSALLENSTVGTLSSDGQRAYVVDDLQLPPFPPMQQFNQWGGGMPGGGTGAYNQWVNPGVQANTLQAISIGSGKLYWLLGGPKATGDDDRPFALKQDFRDTHFLGAPLCLGGKLYFLNEKNQEIRLICLDTGKLPAKDPQQKDLDDAIVWVQKLGTAKEKILVDYNRRTNATHIAYGEGILVCPTNAGVILGVDLLTHSLVWAHAYSDAPAPQVQPEYGGRFRGMPPGMAGNPNAVISSDWKAAPPIIADGKVVFTAPDGPELRCLNLRNGAQIWGLKRSEGDVYLAGVYSGKVVIVGKKDVRALSLDDAREVWRVPTGMPSGRGVASDNVYYLPLKEALFSDKEKGPGIFAIDIEHGKIVAQTRSKKNREGALEVPGNLTFFDGQVISQSVTDIVAYPQLKVKLELMNELLAKNASDPQGLFERGELRLDKGELAGAVEDLHAALNNKPSDELKPRAEAKLFDAMTELLQRDFNNGEKYLKEYETLCLVTLPNADEAKKETQRRRANFLCLVAKGREAQGKLGEALQSYLNFGSLPTAQDELLSVVDEPAVKTKASVWAQGRIKAMIDRATPEQRKPLEQVIADEWNKVKDSGDLEQLRHFVEMFGSTAAIGKEGRLYLAERLMEREGNAALLDAELQFSQLANDDDPAFVARALDGLARLMTRKGVLEDAFQYYKALKVRFPNTPVRDGKTGTQLLEELATDKRFLMYMDEAGDVVGKSRFKGNMERDKNFNPDSQHQIYTFDPINEPLPSLRQHRFGVNPGTNQLKLLDRRTGKELLTEPVNENFSWFLNPAMVMNPGFGMVVQNPAATNRFGYHSVGHLIVANLGQYLVAVDTITHKRLWQKNLFGAYSPGGGNQTPHYDAAEESLQMYFTDGTYMAIAQGGPVEATYVCVLTREGLEALDPLTGKTLWTRNDVSTRCRLFGDANHIYLVELNNASPPVPSTTRAFRAQDGASVVVPNFAALYQKKLRIIGREMLVADTLPGGGLALRLYDVHTGKDLWSQNFPANTTVLHSQDPDLAGVIAPDGRVTGVSLSRRKVVLGGIVDVAHLKNLRQAHLLADAQFVYVMFHTQDPANPTEPWANLQSNSGLRGITVNGEVYAFNRRTSRIEWHNEVKNQQLVLEGWADMPVLLYTSRYMLNGNMGFPGRFPNNQVWGDVYVEAYEKKTGRLFYKLPSTNREAPMGQQYLQVYAVNHDARAGKIEMTANNYKLTITQEAEISATADGTKEKGSKPAAQGGGTEGIPVGRAVGTQPLPPPAEKLIKD